MFKIFSVLLVVFTISLQIWGQCGVYFKESSRQVLSNAIAFGQFEDFDNDGREDLLGFTPTLYSYNLNRMDYQFYFYKRLSNNSFDTTAKITPILNGVPYNGFVSGDVNGDGFRDLVVKVIADSPTIKTYLNDGTGNFTTTTPSLYANDAIWATGDLNGDGKADLITTTGNNLNYRLAQSDSSFGDAVPITSAEYMQPVRPLDGIGGNILVNSYPLLVEDLNGDGLKDIALVVGDNNVNTLKVLTNTGNMTFAQTASFGFSGVITKLRSYDLNNDGKKDFVSDYGAGGATAGSATVAVNNGNNTFATSTLSFPDQSVNSYERNYITKKTVVADLDGDGDLDLLYPAVNAYRIFRNQSAATFTSELVDNAYPGIDQAANLDNDGRADAVYLNFSVINSSYRLYDGRNWNYFYLHNTLSFRKNVCRRLGQTKIIDFNGDGYVDRAFWNPANGTWRYYTQNGPLSYNKVFYQLGVAGDVPVPNDYDGDGKTDYAVYRPSNGTWTIHGSAGQQINQFNFGIAEDKPVPADYDGDGKADIAVYRPSSGDWHFWFSATSRYLAIHFGVSEDEPVPTDYDGDGKADIAVFRPSSGIWYVLNSADYSTTIIQYGLSTDKPVPGDYDGDGKANITVYRDGVWYVLRPNLSTSGMYWGVAGDEPLFNDSLQAPTIGVYRASNSTFHLSYQDSYPGNYAMPTENSSSERFVSSILPPR